MSLLWVIAISLLNCEYLFFIFYFFLYLFFCFLIIIIILLLYIIYLFLSVLIYILSFSNGNTRPSEVQFTVERDPNIEVKEGDIVTINYDHFTQHSIPVNPKLYRIRKDLSWFEVQSNFMSSDQQGQFNGNSFLFLFFKYILIMITIYFIDFKYYKFIFIVSHHMN